MPPTQIIPDRSADPWKRDDCSCAQEPRDGTEVDRAIEMDEEETPDPSGGRAGERRPVRPAHRGARAYNSRAGGCGERTADVRTGHGHGGRAILGRTGPPRRDKPRGQTASDEPQGRPRHAASRLANCPPKSHRRGVLLSAEWSCGTDGERRDSYGHSTVPLNDCHKTGGGCLVVGAWWLAKNPQGRSHVARLSLSLVPPTPNHQPQTTKPIVMSQTSVHGRGPPPSPGNRLDVCGTQPLRCVFGAATARGRKLPLLEGSTMSASPRVQFAWAIIVRGAVGIALAVLAFGVPAMTAALLATLVGAYALTDGAVAVAAGTRARGIDLRSSPFVVEGSLGVLLGLAAFLTRQTAPQLLVPLVAAWGITAGVFRITAAVHVRRPRREWLLALSGAVEVALGLVVLQYQDAGPDGVAGAFGAYAGVGGVMLAACGIRLRRGPAPVPA